jgi:hypothetical protein
MEPLFTAEIIINGQNQHFDVSFHDEQYHFKPSEPTLQAFAFSRIEDEWKITGVLPEIAQQQAIAALDRYLLSQH